MDIQFASENTALTSKIDLEQNISAVITDLFKKAQLKPLARVSTSQLISGGTGTAFGVLSTAVAVPLSFYFGKWLAQQLGASNEIAQSATGVAFAIITPIPIIALTARHSMEVFANFFERHGETYNSVSRKLTKKKLSKKILKELYFCGVAFIAAVSEGYNTYKHFFNVMGYGSLVFIIPDIISPTILCRWSFIGLNQYCINAIKRVNYIKNFNESRITEADIKRRELKSIIIKLEKTIKAKTDADIELLFDTLKTFFNNSQPEDLSEILQKLIDIMNSNSNTSSINRQISKDSTCSRLLGTTIKGIGFGVGVLSSWFYYPLAQQANKAVMNWIGGNTDIYPNIAAASTFICRAGISGKANVEKFYDTYVKIKSTTCKSVYSFFKATKNVLACQAGPEEKNQVKAVCYAALMLLVSAISTSSRAENYREYADEHNDIVDPIFISVAMLGVCVTRFWSLNTFFEVNRKKLDNSNKAKLLYFCTQLSKFIDEMSEEAILLTYQQAPSFKKI